MVAGTNSFAKQILHEFVLVAMKVLNSYDKTNFIKEWWESGDSVTLITRPRRFGKTLNINMLERFFSLKYAKGGEIFSGLSIWKDEKYHKLQGTFPVLSLSFATIKEKNFDLARKKICQLIADLYNEFYFIRDSDRLTTMDVQKFDKISADMGDTEATLAQIDEKKYVAELIAEGISPEHIRKYGFAFKGKEVLIG